jgi:hypothetical protein
MCICVIHRVANLINRLCSINLHVPTPLTKWSVVVCWWLSRPRSRPRGRGHVGHPWLLLHPWHGPLALHGHLQVVWQGLAAVQHLVGHDLGPELVQLVLVEGGGSTWSNPTWHRTTTQDTTEVLLGHGLGVTALHGDTWARRHHGAGWRAVGWHRAGRVLRTPQWRGVAWGGMVGHDCPFN